VQSAGGLSNCVGNVDEQHEKADHAGFHGGGEARKDSKENGGCIAQFVGKREDYG
jgi:hypothetical protein